MMMIIARFLDKKSRETMIDDDCEIFWQKSH